MFGHRTSNSSYIGHLSRRSSCDMPWNFQKLRIIDGFLLFQGGVHASIIGQVNSGGPYVLGQVQGVQPSSDNEL